MIMRFDVVTLFPEMLSGFLESSILKKARDANLIDIRSVNPRDFTTDKHRTCDDRPFGGGSGMVLKPEPVLKAVESVRTAQSKTILMSPQGKTFSQAAAMALSREKHLILVCGHYEGVDERIKSLIIDEEISIGDYILTNGALAAAVIVDAVSRLIPGVLGNPESAQEESFSGGVLEYPQYTRPREFRGLRVPEILLSGDHAKIREWRKAQALERTRQKKTGERI